MSVLFKMKVLTEQIRVPPGDRLVNQESRDSILTHARLRFLNFNGKRVTIIDVNIT